MNCTITYCESATTTHLCDRTAILLDPALLKFLRQGVRCKVQLMSEKLELDAYQVPVPKDWKVIELIVLDESRAAIERIVASTPEYQGFKVVDCWQVIDGAQPF